jgi:DHA1 family bicyclomycin/chloramphenicol resistance-like MFS transporter
MSDESFKTPRHFTLLLGFIIAVGPVSVDMYLPAFGAIAARFGATAPQFTLAAYFFGFALGQLSQGLLSDRLGRRRPLALGLGLYVAASIGCACAQSTAGFCCFRALAAFGAAASIVVPRAMVRDVANGPQAARLMSNVMQVMSIAPILAPVLGSATLFFAGWRMIFIVAAVYGVISLYLLYRHLPETLPPERRFARGPAAIILYGQILRDPKFVSHALIGAFGMSALFAYLAGLPTVLMGQYHFTQMEFGLTLACLGAATIGFFRINGTLVVRHGTGKIIGFGILFWSLACAALLVSGWLPALGSFPILLFLLIFGLGYSFIPANAQIGALSRHGDHAASATALMSTLQYSAGAVAGALTGAFADGTARPMAAIMLACSIGAALAARYARQD